MKQGTKKLFGLFGILDFLIIYFVVIDPCYCLEICLLSYRRRYFIYNKKRFPYFTIKKAYHE